MPRVGRAFLALAAAITAIPGLSPKAREIAILTTGSTYKAGYELYAHRIIGLRCGLSESQINEIKQGRMPSHLDEQEAVSYQVAYELTRKPGPLSAALWEKTEKLLGLNGAKALVNLVGFYSYVSIFLNGFDVAVPDVKPRL